MNYQDFWITLYYLLLQALLMILPARTQILVTGLFKRKDVDEQCIVYSNRVLKDLASTINVEEVKRQVQQNDRVYWMESPEEIEWKHPDDNVHLNTNGYQIWDAILYSKIQQLLGAEI